MLLCESIWSLSLLSKELRADIHILLLAVYLTKYIGMPTIFDLDSESILAVLLELDVRDILVCQQVRVIDYHWPHVLILYFRSANGSGSSSSLAQYNTSATSPSLAL